MGPAWPCHCPCSSAPGRVQTSLPAPSPPHLQLLKAHADFTPDDAGPSTARFPGPHTSPMSRALCHPACHTSLPTPRLRLPVPLCQTLAGAAAKGRPAFPALSAAQSE